MTGNALLAGAIARLRAAGVPDPVRDARRLLAFALEMPPGRLTLVLPEEVAAEPAARFETLVTRREGRVPVSHLTGVRAFYGRDFAVTPDVLDPRPESETLVGLALEAGFARVLDLGTGSGCLLLSLVAERPEATGLGTDLSDAALDVARGNAARLGLEARATFAQGSWFAAVPPARFDLIVSNPPYIAAGEMAALAPELAHEPRQALTDESDGLAAYREITARAADYLAPSGRLMVEIGPTQATAVAGFFAQSGLEDVAVHRDLDGRDRVVSGVLAPQTR